MLREHPFPGLQGEEVFSLCVIMLLSSYYVTLGLSSAAYCSFLLVLQGGSSLKHKVPIMTSLPPWLRKVSPFEVRCDSDCCFQNQNKCTVIGKFYCSCNILIPIELTYTFNSFPLISRQKVHFSSSKMVSTLQGFQITFMASMETLLLLLLSRFSRVRLCVTP